MIALTFSAFVFVGLSQSNDVSTQSKLQKTGSTPQSSHQEMEERKLNMPAKSKQIPDYDTDLIEYQKWEKRVRALTETRDLSGLAHCQKR